MKQKYCNGKHRPAYRQRAVEKFADLCIGRQRNRLPCPKVYNNIHLMRFLIQYPWKWIFHGPYQPEKADILMNELRSLVLTHWQNYHPTMLAELEKENRLEETLKVTEEQIIDLMYDLEVVNKM